MGRRGEGRRGWALRVTTSGAIQYGVPTMVLRLLCSGVIWAQKPKSAVRRTEDRGQRTEDRGQRKEERGQRAEERGKRKEDRVSVTTSVNEPPARYSITTHSSSPTRFICLMAT
ncbi:hypothetical protein EYF80_012077 [Liparis tanakae]|uniref:Uncharacterized protein n=1 Tax=Liparis tanakae TaxID=230148 RepID=A0A4Z2IIE1_9TELE|nr:hypothetical protein EYF80_012077 [Liparis tanakae]